MSLLQHFKIIVHVICFLAPAVIFAPVLRAGVSPSEVEKATDIIGKMEAAYANIEAYQTETDVNEYRDGRLTGTQRFHYTFKKPDHIRIDMESPHPGWVLVYPDKDGEILVKPSGWTGFLKFHLSLDSTFLKNSAGQRFDQTDLGLLIRNIAHSLTDKRRGELKISGQNGRILIEVTAEDHFLPGVVTRYRFSIDRKLMLPVEVEEFTPDGIIKRKVMFRNLHVSTALPDGFFRINGGGPAYGQPGK
jgi:outer membrane lipoprotein-sorting protein